MAIDFPDEPDVHDIFTDGGKTWIYDGVKWSITAAVNDAKELDDLDDVVINSPQENQVLLYNGADWGNSNIPGVADGGTVGQVLAKIDSEDYNTEWVTPTVYASTGKAIAMAIVFGG
jgi:hypothetical protein